MSQIYKTQFTASLLDGLVAHFNPALSRTYTTGSDTCYDILNHAYGDMSNANHSYSNNSIVLNDSGSLVLSQSHSNTYGILSGSDHTLSIWFKPEETGKQILAQENELFNIYLTKSHQVYVGMFPSNNLLNVAGMGIDGDDLWVISMLVNNNGAVRVYDKNTFKLKHFIAIDADSDNFSYFDSVYVYGNPAFSGSNDIYMGSLRSIVKYDKDYIFNPTASAYGYRSDDVADIGREEIVKYFNYGSGTAAGGYVGFISGLYMDDDYFWFTDRSNDRVQKVTRDGTYVDHVDIASSDLYSGCSDGTNYFAVDYGTDKIYKYDLATLTLQTSIGSYGGGNDQFRNPLASACDGTYLYICDYGNDRIKKHTCSDLSYVAQIAIANTPRSITVDDDFVYVHCKYGANGNGLYKIEKDLSAFVQIMPGHNPADTSPLSDDPWMVYGGKNITIETEAEPGVDFLHTADRYSDYKRYRLDGYGNIDTPHYYKTLTGSPYYSDATAILATGSYVYTGGEQHIITQWNYSDMTTNNTFGTYGTSGRTTSLSNRPECFSTDGTYLYITEYTNELCKLLESNNISIVHTTTCSVIIRPDKITSVIVRDITPNSTDISTEKIDDEVLATEDSEAGIISD